MHACLRGYQITGLYYFVFVLSVTIGNGEESEQDVLSAHRSRTCGTQYEVSPGKGDALPVAVNMCSLHVTCVLIRDF